MINNQHLSSCSPRKGLWSFHSIVTRLEASSSYFSHHIIPHFSCISLFDHTTLVVAPLRYIIIHLTPCVFDFLKLWPARSGLNRSHSQITIEPYISAEIKSISGWFRTRPKPNCSNWFWLESAVHAVLWPPEPISLQTFWQISYVLYWLCYKSQG